MSFRPIGSREGERKYANELITKLEAELAALPTEVLVEPLPESFSLERFSSSPMSTCIGGNWQSMCDFCGTPRPTFLTRGRNKQDPIASLRPEYFSFASIAV